MNLTQTSTICLPQPPSHRLFLCCEALRPRGGARLGEDSLLERVTAAAEERELSQNSLIAYRRTWLKIIAWAAAEGCR
jgi:hypothetical protein